MIAPNLKNLEKWPAVGSMMNTRAPDGANIEKNVEKLNPIT